MSYQILGLAGQQGAGKDYTYDALRSLYSGDYDAGLGDKRKVRRMAFADGVRREVTLEVFKALGFDVKGTDGAAQWNKPYTEGQRWILQQWGTEYRRAQDPDYWVHYGMDYIAERAEPGDLWVVTDVRFANEAAAISSFAFERYGGRVALVTATAEERARRVGITPQELAKRSQHASEVIDFSTDFQVMNETSIVLPQDLLEWLGLPRHCLKCAFAEPHIWHDGGYAFE